MTPYYFRQKKISTKISTKEGKEEKANIQYAVNLFLWRRNVYIFAFYKIHYNSLILSQNERNTYRILYYLDTAQLFSYRVVALSTWSVSSVTLLLCCLIFIPKTAIIDAQKLFNSVDVSALVIYSRLLETQEWSREKKKHCISSPRALIPLHICLHSSHTCLHQMSLGLQN